MACIAERHRDALAPKGQQRRNPGLLVASGGQRPSAETDRPENVRKIGAGDEIRTHDPNLGKVVLYP